MKKGFLLKLICLFITLLFVFSMSGCGNIDPNLQNSGEGFSDTDQSDSLKQIDADFFALRGYELCVLLAQRSFETPEQISVNALVQFCMCHLFYDDLTKMPRNDFKLRTATVQDINRKINEYFEDLNVDITKSDLYNPSKKQFEMWEPNYGRDIYYTASAAQKAGGLFEVKADFYSDAGKTAPAGTVSVTLFKKGGKFYIKGASLY